MRLGGLIVRTLAVLVIVAELLGLGIASCDLLPVPELPLPANSGEVAL